jgi:hypothetical protein
MIMEVCKALYGLVESAMLWYEELISQLKSIGYTVIESDRAVVMKRDGNANIIAGIHVDDIISSTSPDGAHLEKELWDHLTKVFKKIKKQTGPTYRFLSFDIDYDREKGIILISQQKYLEEILSRHSITSGVANPTNGEFMKRSKNSELINVRDFKSKVMQVAYLVTTRPDIAFPVNYLIMHSHEPTVEDDQKLNRLMQFLYHTRHFVMTIAPKSLQLVASADASYAIHDNGRSHYGNIISLGENNSPIHVKSASIKTVVRSSTEAEIHGVNELVSDVDQAVKVMTDLGYKQQTVVIYEDNKSAIILITQKQKNFQTRSKHIKVRYEYLRELVEKKIIKLVYQSTDDMTADGLSKSTGGKKYEIFSQKLLNR